MNKREDGGPAFPAPAQPKTDMQLEDVTSGVTLRDYAAVHILSGMLANPHNKREATFEQMAADALTFADALLKERLE